MKIEDIELKHLFDIICTTPQLAFQLAKGLKISKTELIELFWDRFYIHGGSDILDFGLVVIEHGSEEFENPWMIGTSIRTRGHTWYGAKTQTQAFEITVGLLEEYE